MWSPFPHWVHHLLLFLPLHRVFSPRSCNLCYAHTLPTYTFTNRDETFTLTWPSRCSLLSNNFCTRKNKNQFNERERFRDFPRPVTDGVPFTFQGQAGSEMVPLKVSYTTQEKLIPVVVLQEDREREHICGRKFTAIVWAYPLPLMLSISVDIRNTERFHLLQKVPETVSSGLTQPLLFLK